MNFQKLEENILLSKFFFLMPESKDQFLETDINVKIYNQFPDILEHKPGIGEPLNLPFTK